MPLGSLESTSDGSASEIVLSASDFGCQILCGCSDAPAVDLDSVFESLRSRSLGSAVDDCWNAALGLGRSWPKPFLTTFARAHQTVCVA